MGEKISGAVLRLAIGETMMRSKEEEVVLIMDMVTMKEEVASEAEVEDLAEETSVVAAATIRMAVAAMVDMVASEVDAEEWAVDLVGAGEVSGARA